jgi:hypothetical protein
MEKMETQILPAIVNSNVQSQQSFIEAFKEYMTCKSDVCTVFQEVIGLNLVSLAVGRSFIDTNFDEKILTYVWTIIIGYSTYVRKSAILKQAKLMIPEEAHLLPDEYTKEAFFKELSKDSKGLNVWDECAPVLKHLNSTQNYQSEIDDTLMALSTGETRVKALQSGNVTITEPCFNLLWATTFTNFDKYISKANFSTGFMARFLVIIGDECKNINLLAGQTSEPTKEKFKIAKQRLKEIWDFFHAKECKFIFSNEAEEVINERISEKHKIFVECDIATDKEFLGALYGRAQEYVIKLSAIYEADTYQLIKLSSENNIEISKESALKSINYMNIMISMLSAKLLSLQSSDWLSTNIAKLSKMLSKCEHKRAERQFLSSRLHLTAEQLNTVLTTAKDYGMIEITGVKPQIIILLKTYEELRTSVETMKEPVNKTEVLPAQIAVPTMIPV